MKVIQEIPDGEYCAGPTGRAGWEMCAFRHGSRQSSNCTRHRCIVEDCPYPHYSKKCATCLEETRAAREKEHIKANMEAMGI